MVIGFLKDGRLEEERKRTERERKRADDAEAKIHEARIHARVAEAEAKNAKERAQHEQERADHLLSELNRARERYEAAADAIIQHLRDQNGPSKPEPGSDA